MRIHHVTPHFHPEIGGVETQVRRLAEFLVGRGHEVVVHTSRRSQRGQWFPEKDRLGTIEIRRYSPSIRMGYYTTLFRPQILRADVIHLHGYGHAANDWTVRSHRDRVPTVFSLHHGVAQAPPNLLARAKRALYDPLIGARVLRTVRAIVAASEADRPWLDRNRVPRDRVYVLPTGIEDASFAPGAARRARERFQLDRYVLFVGRLHREKSVDHLLRAVASLRADAPFVVLAGPDGGAGRDLETLSRSLGLTNRTRVLGPVDEATKRDLLAGCECLVLPSFYEAQGISILEAWAQGRPVIASRVGGIPYLVQEGADGLLYPWGDIRALARHIEAILGDASTSDRMGRAGRNKAWSEYRWSKIAPRFEDIYVRVCTPGT